MRHRCIPRTVTGLAILFAVCFVGAPPASAGQQTFKLGGKIVVDHAGVAGKEVSITIVTELPGGGTLTDVIKFIPTATDVASTTAKAARIDKEIKSQATGVLSQHNLSNVTDILTDTNNTLKSVKIDPGDSKEKDRVNPKELGSSSAFTFAATGVGSVGGIAELDIGGPGGGLFTIPDTAGMTGIDILSAFQSQVNLSTPFPTSLVGDELRIEGISTDNDIVAFIDDEAFTYEYGFVPEPASAACLLLTGALLLNRRR